MLLSELYAIYLCVHKRPKSRVVISGFLLSYPLQVRFVQAYFRPCTRLLCVFRVAVDHIMVLYNVDCACVQLAPSERLHTVSERGTRAKRALPSTTGCRIAHGIIVCEKSIRCSCALFRCYSTYTRRAMLGLIQEVLQTD